MFEDTMEDLYSFFNTDNIVDLTELERNVLSAKNSPLFKYGREY